MYHDEPRRDTPLVLPGCPITDAQIVDMLTWRRAAIEHGHWIVQINSPWSGATGAMGRGKAPLGKDWQVPRWRPNILKADPLWSRAGFNTGLLLGGPLVIGSDGKPSPWNQPNPIQAIDIDVDDAGQVAAIELLMVAMLPDAQKAIRRFRRNSPRPLYLAQCDRGATKRAAIGAGGKVERLGLGQQAVIHGYHPSGAALEWTGDRGPHSVHFTDLPMWTEAQVDALLNAIVTRGIIPEAAIAGSGATTSRPPGGAPRSPGAADGGGGVLREALRAKVQHHAGDVVAAIHDLFREIGAGGAGRHDALLSAGGLLIRRGWPTDATADLLARAALSAFTTNIEPDRDLYAEARAIARFAADREAVRAYGDFDGIDTQSTSEE